MKKKIKVLYIVPSLRLCNGVASYAMNYFRSIDKDKIQIDFVIGINERSIYFDEIEKCGSKIFYIPTIGIKNSIKTIKTIKKFIKENSKNYDIIHCHVLNMGAFYLHYAKKYGIKVRILHSHATQYADKLLNNIRNTFFSIFAKKEANTYFACSKLAGDFLFKNKKYSVINNAINVNKFIFNEDIRRKIRKNEKVADGETLIANVGRFVPQKNLLFLIDVFYKVSLVNDNYKLLLIGSGPLEEKIKQKINDYKLKSKIIIKKNITNVNEYMQAADLFVLPSLFEGLPVVGIEAQCSDLPCLFSNKITLETQILDNCKFIEIDNTNTWVNEILNFKKIKRENRTNEMIKYGFKIEEAVKELEKIYYNLVKLEE